MNKKSTLMVLIDLVFLVVFNAVFFIAGGFQHPASVWIAYGFIHFAYLMTIATPLFVGKKGNPVVMGMPVESVSSGYFFLELIVGVLFIFAAAESYALSLVIQIILAGVYLAALLTVLAANEQTAKSVAKHEAEVAYIKNVATELKALQDKASDKKANKALERAYDEVHASPVKSAPAAAQLEQRIYQTVTALKEAVKQDNAEQIIAIAGEITELTEERNRALRQMN